MPAAQRDVRQRDIGQNPPEGLVCARRGGQAVALPGPWGSTSWSFRTALPPTLMLFFPKFPEVLLANKNCVYLRCTM